MHYSRTLIIFAFVIAIVVGCVTLRVGNYFSIISLLMSSLSAYLAIRDSREDAGYITSKNFIIITFRKIVYSDKNMAIFLIQLALICQSIAILLPSPDK